MSADPRKLSNTVQKESFKAAFVMSIPIMTGYIFLGASFGVYALSQGIPWFIPVLMSVIIYAGSGQFALIPALLLPFSPLSALLLMLIINARHMFYAITMLQRYRHLPAWIRWYCILGLTDETFSLVASVDQATLDKMGHSDANIELVYGWVTLLDHIYWLGGTILGIALYHWISFDISGLEFVLTALFATIFFEQWLSTKEHTPALAGLLIGLISRWMFGAGHFMIPAMIGILLFFGMDYYRKHSGRRGEHHA